MAILENDKTIEQLEFSAGITDIKEFVYSYDASLFVPSGIAYHKIITKTKRVVYQTFPNPQKYSKEIIRVRNKSDIEGYLEAKSNNIKVSKYYKNEKVKPKKKDYKKGFFIRYFLQLASDDKAPVIEVIKSKHTNADAIYSKAQMRWSLSKDIEEQERLNIKNTLEVEKTFPQIRMKIYNFVEFGKES
jgi:hypothetical protein